MNVNLDIDTLRGWKATTAVLQSKALSIALVTFIGPAPSDMVRSRIDLGKKVFLDHFSDGPDLNKTLAVSVADAIGLAIRGDG